MRDLWEDHLLERKVESDLKDLLKTLVAFANSVRPGHTAVILIGERDDGTVQGVTNPDSIQKTVRKECEKIYPAIVWRTLHYQKEGKDCIRVEIEHSGDTPHFGGSAWVRSGSSTVEASDEVFQRLIDIRSNIVRELSLWVDKNVTITPDESTIPRSAGGRPVFSRWYSGEREATLISVNGFWIMFEIKGGEKRSEPVNKLSLSFDHKNNRLEIVVSFWSPSAT